MYNGSTLTWTRRIKHLGNIITCDLKNSEISRLKRVPLYHRSTGLTAKCLKYLAMLRASCYKHIAVRGMDVKHGISPASLRARWTLNGIQLFAALLVPYTTHTNILPLLVKGKPFMTQHFSLPCVKICTIFCSFNNNNNTSVVFYRSTGALQFLWCSW